MKPIDIEGSDMMPNIHLDGEKGEFVFEGKSNPYNVNESYAAVLNYIQKYTIDPQPLTTVVFKWQFFNSATAKIIFKILILLRGAETELQVKWYADKDFRMMNEKGNELKELLGINLDLVQE